MNQEKIPLKYTLGIWKSTKTYPTKMDVLYEVYEYLNKSNKTEFSEQTLNSVWFDQSGSGNWKDTIKQVFFNELITDGTFIESKNTGDKIWYKIEEKLNPFI